MTGDGEHKKASNAIDDQQKDTKQDSIKTFKIIHRQKANKKFLE